MHYFLCAVLILLPLGLQASDDTDRDDIRARIKPVGSVHVDEQNPVESEKKKPETMVARSAQSIYEQHCIVCHRDGIAGAPKFRDKTTWNPRLAGRDINALAASAIQGKNAMPAKGTCQECSDSDIKAAVEYMVPK